MIGVFDSGFGGLTVLKEFLRILPQYDYIYLGDNARAPYGNKSDEVIYEYTRQAVDFLFSRGCELIVIACHTASAKALRKIQQEYLPAHHPHNRVLGVAVPLVEEAINLSKHKAIGIIGTKATIESHLYKKEIEKKQAGLEVYEQACPLLVPLVEEGWINRPETKMILKKYLRPLKEKKVSALVLGCTHYPLLAKEIQRIMGARTAIINPAQIVAQKLQKYLENHPEIEEKIKKSGKITFYTTDNERMFKNLGQKFLGEAISETEKIILC